MRKLLAIVDITLSITLCSVEDFPFMLRVDICCAPDNLNRMIYVGWVTNVNAAMICHHLRHLENILEFKLYEKNQMCVKNKKNRCAWFVLKYSTHLSDIEWYTALKNYKSSIVISRIKSLFIWKDFLHSRKIAVINHMYTCRWIRMFFVVE